MHFANIGVQVLLYDIVPFERTEEEVQAGIEESDPRFRYRMVKQNFEHFLKLKPAPLYHKAFADRITLKNLDDDLQELASCDWIMEVVVERLDIKRQLFEKIEAYRKPGTLITSNTSGIPIRLMNEGRSDDFKKHFCGTHFFNPPRYLQLFELIPGPDTDQEILDFLMQYADRFLGKTAVLCKDTPAFIANRIGIYSIMSLFHSVRELDLTVEEVDKLTGPVLGRPKSATFRTCDVVGLDTLVHVANGLHDSVKEDEMNHLFALPEFIGGMMENQWLGSKSGQGFYKKLKNAEGKSEILSLDLNTLEYRPKQRAKFPTLELTKTISDLRQRVPVLFGGKDKAGAFYRKSFAGLFAYVSHRIPEITNDIFRVDEAMKAGFGWELGPFEYWDAYGVTDGVQLSVSEGFEVASWVSEAIDKGMSSFYRLEEGKLFYWDISSGAYKIVPGQEGRIVLDHIRAVRTVWENKESVIEDLGDGILNIEFRSKMNTLGAGVIQGINKAIDLAEKEYRGLVIGNQGGNFSVGANLGLIFLMAVEQDYDELNMAVRTFQNTVMRLRYSSIPVVIAPHSMTLGGGCEMTLHADAAQLAAETYIGLVEFGVGLIPGGAGTKEMTVRASERYMKDDVELNTLREYYLSIGMAKVATSAYEAFDLGIIQRGKDRISVNKSRQLADAKSYALELADLGYVQPSPKKVKVLGRPALGMFKIGAHAMWSGHYISDHDRKISEKLAYVMSGGDLSEPTYVSEQYLLDLEREAFLSLCGERKTLERIQHMLKTGKPLRN
jgi:3-hydroxyacyl-CoA dehydrogenase